MSARSATTDADERAGTDRADGRVLHEARAETVVGAARCAAAPLKNDRTAHRWVCHSVSRRKRIIRPDKRLGSLGCFEGVGFEPESDTRRDVNRVGQRYLSGGGLPSRRHAGEPLHGSGQHWHQLVRCIHLIHVHASALGPRLRPRPHETRLPAEELLRLGCAAHVHLQAVELVAAGKVRQEDFEGGRIHVRGVQRCEETAKTASGGAQGKDKPCHPVAVRESESLGHLRRNRESSLARSASRRACSSFRRAWSSFRRAWSASRRACSASRCAWSAFRRACAASRRACKATMRRQVD